MNDNDIEDKALKTKNVVAEIERIVNSQLFTAMHLKLSVSLGFTITEEGDSVLDLISRADKNMYENKFKKKR